MPTTTLGHMLRTARMRSGRTQRDIARELGLTSPSVNAWEMDRAMPTIERVGEILDTYAFTTSERIELAILLGVLRNDDLLAAAA